jgi:translation initiation factor IF-2
MDCGLNIQGYNDVKVGDVVEAYTIEEIKRTL